MAGRIVSSSWNDWSGSRTNKGHRVYRIKFLVETSSQLEGPATVLATPGLPVPGSLWNFGLDFDLWAWCRYEADIRPVQPKPGDPTRHWTIEFTFSTEPVGRCQLLPVENPILEPMDISGAGIRYSYEALYDRFGNRVTNSAHQQIRGPQVEFDKNRPSVRFKWNVLDLQLPLLVQMVDTLNESPLWGLPARTIKLSNYSWTRKFFGICSVYYERTLEFDVNYVYNPQLKQWVSGFDRDIMDEGTKVLQGHWDPATGSWVPDAFSGYGGTPNPDPSNPNHFIAARDRANNTCSIPLDGAGQPGGVTRNGDPVLVLGSTPLIATTYTADQLTQPSAGNPAQIQLFLTRTVYANPDPDGPSQTIAQGTVAIAGLDADGAPLLEQVTFDTQLAAGSTAVYFKTQAYYQAITSITVVLVQAADASDRILVQTSTTKPNIGNRHVEYYPQSNFLLLGVPVSF